MAETPVKLHIYDLSKGMARALSQMWLGKHLDGVWHTGVVAYNKEYFYGGMGIENCPPGTLQMGPPDTVVDLGTTGIPFELFLDWMNGMAMTTFKGSRYHLLDHNCNTFSNEMAQFLTGKSIPSYITDLPSEILSTPLGQQIRIMLDQASNSATATPVGADPSREFGSTSSARSAAYDAEEEELMAAAQAAINAPLPRATARLPRDADASDSEDDIVSAPPPPRGEAKKPVVFPTADITEVYAQLQRGLGSMMPAEDAELLDEIFEYATTSADNNLLLSMSKNHFTFLSDILVSEELKSNIKILSVKMLQFLLQSSSAINVLRFCPEHPILEYLLLLGRQRNSEPEELLEAIKMICNACNTTSGFSWLTDETEWSLEDVADKTSNVDTVAQFCTWSVGKQAMKDVQEAAITLAYNLSIPEISDQLAESISLTLLKVLTQPGTTLTDGAVQNVVSALANFCDVSTQVAHNIKAQSTDWNAVQAKYPKSKDVLSTFVQKIQS